MPIFDKAPSVNNIIEKCPIPAAYIKHNKIITSNDLWNKEKILLEELNEQIINDKWLINIIPISEKDKIVFLTSVEELLQAHQKIKLLQKELEKEKQTLKLLVQNAPISMLILDIETTEILFFNNDRIIEMCQIDYNTFYGDMKLTAFLKDASKINMVINQTLEKETLRNFHIDVILKNNQKRWWGISSSVINYKDKRSILMIIEDITLQKEQEQKLAEAYQEIQAQNEMLNQHQEELIVLNENLRALNEKLQQQKKELEEGLKYARKVQQKVLYPENKIKETLKPYELGIWFAPHTYVSGDFIWIQEKNDYIYLGVCDATGHGAAGSLMALLGNMALNQAFETLTSPQDIGNMLKRTQNIMIELLNVKNEKIASDGFEIILLALPKKYENEITLFYSQAKRPLFLAKNENILVDKPNTHPIGFVWDYKYDWNFPVNKLTINKNDTLYLLTDGITDQVGNLNNNTPKKLGTKNLVEILKKIHKLPAEKQTEIIKSTIMKWKNDNPQTDDITLIVLKLK